MDDEEVLLKVMDSDITGSSSVIDKTMFKFEGNNIYFAKEVNDEACDSEINHAIEEAKLDIVIDESWTEALFYGIGNKNV